MKMSLPIDRATSQSVPGAFSTPALGPAPILGRAETPCPGDEAAIPAEDEPGPHDTELSVLFSQAVREAARRNVAEEQFLSSNEVVHLMVNNIKDYGIIKLDPEGRIVAWNAGQQAINGYLTAEALGKQFSVFYTEGDIQNRKPEQELGCAISTGRCEVNGWRMRKDGTRFWANTVLTALRDVSGKLLGFAMVTHDLSEQKRAEALGAASAAELASANQQLNSFAYAVSHDLRAPLRQLDGFTELLRTNCYEGLDPQGRRYLDKIAACGQRMGRLIDDLLSFSRLLRADFSLGRVSLRSLQAEVQRDFEAALAGRSVVWIVGALPDVHGDRSMLRQVFVNLLSNAVKYSRGQAETRIEIGCSDRTEEEATVFVRDNGVGFDMQYVGKLFDVFQRLHSNEFEGSGLGLAYVRRIVERHGGRVSADAVVGRGATFYFSLPLYRGKNHA
jgi:PAS domain S-box-containing protein